MRLFLFRCENGHEFDVFLRGGEEPRPRPCHCGAIAKRKWCVNFHVRFFDPHYDPALGRVVLNKHDYRQKFEEMREKLRPQYGDRVDKMTVVEDLSHVVKDGDTNIEVKGSQGIVHREGKPPRISLDDERT